MNHLDICLPQKGVAADTPVHRGPAASGLVTKSHLLEGVDPVRVSRSSVSLSAPVANGRRLRETGYIHSVCRRLSVMSFTRSLQSFMTTNPQVD